MTRQPDCYEGLRRAVREQYGPAAARILDGLCDLAVAEHAGQLRKSGDPYITHPIEVARLVASWGQPFSLVCTALLHDVRPRRLGTWVAHGLIGEDIRALVVEVARLNDRRLQNPEALAGSPRDAVVVKIAGRLHNARTWNFVPRLSAREKARTTLALYTPKAMELGLARVADELRSLSTATLNPDAEPMETMVDLGDSREVSPQQHLAGASGRLLGRAVMLLPPAQRVRYLEEWTAELLDVVDARVRLRTAMGLQYSAFRIRAQSRD
jgi:GTP diphosphokinase / guanosine-3',5'-bis(diphosphate) 3'-diphosphatase